MLLYYIKLAWRNLVWNKTFSAINIAGLSIGLTSCLIIGFYVYTELSFDKFHRNHDRIYRINKIVNEKGKVGQRDGITPGLLAPALEKELPEVTYAGRFRPWFNDMLVSHDTVKLKLKEVAYADQSFLQIFDFPIIQGDRNSALKEPFTAVITESSAKKYFSNRNPVGQQLITLNNIPVTISAVAKDPPPNSSIQFSMLISWPTIIAPANTNYFFWMNSWNTQVDFSFVLLKQSVRANQVGKKISTLLHSHFAEKEFSYTTYLQPLDEIHLNSAGIFYAEQFKTNNGTIVYTLLIIATFILLIASFNFINLSTSASLGRAKETGVQKVLGAGRFQLLIKFFAETVLLLAISMLCSILFIAILLPLFNELAGSNLSAATLLEPRIISVLLLILLLLSLLAGTYPAVFLSRFRSADVFRNIVRAGKDVWLRRSLVTIQFALSILLIIATIVVNKQTQFLHTRDLGFDRDQVLAIQIANTNLETKTQELASAFRQDPGIASITVTNRVPGQTFNGYGVIPEGFSLSDHIMANVLETDANFPSTYNIQITKGRFFSPEMPTDTAQSVVINETMARKLNWKDPIGKQFEVYEETKGRVIGVVRDFNFASLRENIQPLVIMLRKNPLYMSVRIKPNATQSSLENLKRIWRQFDPQEPLEYFFMSEQMDHFYDSDQKLLKALSLFASLAIAVACFGLFGLAIYSARQRTKEIGIRKVLGARVYGIVLLLSKEFLKLVLFASILSIPVAWWASNWWLADFAYRIGMSWWIFILGSAAVALVAMITVSFQAIKAALANPVKSLRSE
ncbi:MAG: ABC transporter permease [Chitinophagales bacterium]